MPTLAVTKCSALASTNGRANTAAIRSAAWRRVELARNVLEQDRELVAAEAGDGVGWAQRLLSRGATAVRIRRRRGGRGCR